MGTITLDFETRSEADLKKVGPWAYSEHPSTEVICAAWGFEDEPVRTWEMGEPRPISLFCLIEDGHRVEAHNISFEYAIWQNVCVPRMGWVPVAEDKWDDTMAVACYYAMPAALDRLARVCGYEGKDPEGGRLITKYSKLNLKTSKRDIPPEDLAKFVAYCVKDVQIEQTMSDYLGDLPKRERDYFQLDQIVNRRGILLDLNGIARATLVVDKRAAKLEDEFREIVGLNPTQTDKFKDWLEEHGWKVDNLQAETIDEELAHDLAIRENRAQTNSQPMTPEVRRALEIRREISKASTKKLDAMARQVGSDGRARYQTRYHGAVSGRNTGAGFQPLNLTRNWEHVDPEQLVRDIHYGCDDWLDLVYGDAMEAVSKASRHWITAAPGHRIMAGDFASIEAIILACLAGEDWKIEAFRRKEKLYERMAEKIHKLPFGTVTKETHPLARQDGKTGELAFGYQGALGAWLKFDSSGRHTDERIIEICRAWRDEHPMTVALWSGLNEAAMEAALHKRLTGYRDIGFEMVDEWLSMILPSGKRIWYRDPIVKWGMPRWHQPKDNEDCAAGTCRCREQPRLTYMAMKEGQWKRVSTYGGKLCVAADTEVLTDRGWVDIVNVQSDDLLWDGIEWVHHGGLIEQGRKQVVDLEGVKMTPDHLVLTGGGWRCASQSEGYYRHPCGLPYRPRVHGQRRAPLAVGSGVHSLWGLADHGCFRGAEAGATGRAGVVRVPQAADHQRAQADARYVPAPSVCGLEVYGRPLLAAFASSVEKLRRAGNHGLRAMATVVRELLERHGADLSAGASDRTDQQRRSILARQLPVGHAGGSGGEPEVERMDRDTPWQAHGFASRPAIWPQPNHNPLATAERVDGLRSVYDIANAGPRKRFVVRCRDGRPLIVHNCENACQATSREVLKPAALAAEAAGYPVILTVYDEIVAEVPDGFGSKQEFTDLMVGPHEDWYSSYPISAEVWSGQRYKK